MNEKKLKKIFIMSFLILFLSPKVVFAEVNSGSESFPVNHESDCQNYLNISISASAYSRATTINTDSVSPRTITMSCKGRCKAYIYYADYGDLEKIGENADAKGDRSTSDEDEESTDVKKHVKTFSNSYSWSLGAGKEALIVVLSLDKKECSEKNDKGECTKWEYQQKVAKKKDCNKNGKNCKWVKITATTKDANGNDVVVDVTCPRGRFNTDDDPQTIEEVKLKGNGAALFVQNPKESGLVINLRHRTSDYGEACKNAYNGVYTGISGDDVKKFSITSENYENIESVLNDYRTNYYTKMLNYCESTYVPFNLKSSQIKNISNNLLKVFYYRKQLEAGNYKKLSDVQQEIYRLEKYIAETYGKSHISNDPSGVSRNLTCDKTASTDKEEEYLYKTKEDKVYANLSTGKVPVCTTQCYEHLTVKYNPPALLKAGLCFSYKVTVKSKTECGVKDDFDLSKVNVPNACSPSPICENSTGHTQPGPNEEFDSCIKECDDGNYSQKCINSCYKKVYGNKKKVKTNGNNSNNKVNSMSYTNSNAPIIRYLASDDNYSEEYLKGYAAEDNNPSCNTEHIIKYVHNGNSTALDTCADYFFQAKTLNPHGNYNSNGTKWEPDNSVSDAGAGTESTTNIPMQIARSAPFYTRSAEETKTLLISMVVPLSPSGLWRKYNIDAEGFRRQYSSRYKCSQTCSFTGCSSSDALTSSEYSKDLKNDLNEISDALSRCVASSSCDTEEKTTTFEMKINVKRENNNSENPTQSGTTTLGETIGKNGLDADGDGNTDMFVAEGKNDPGTGILGLCYDKRNEPHYQTTITYPGTYINYKHAKRVYSEINDETYVYKKNYLCTPYDSVDVNEKYWLWGQRDKFNPSLYPSDFSPEYNISATLGKTNTGFGRYNWKINFSCFYSIYNEIPVPISTPTPTPKDSCNSEYSSKFCNTRFRIVTTDNLFPDKNGNKKSANEIPYNWSSDAQDKVAAASSNSQIKSYGINPADYKEKLETVAENNSEASFSGNMAYHIYLTKENIQALKGYVKQHGYTSFRGTYRPIEGQDILYYYTMSKDLTDKFTTFDNSHANKGYNYSTHNYQ